MNQRGGGPRLRSMLLFAIGLWIAGGCGRNGTPASAVCYPVKGRVLLDGQPLAEARLIFHSVGDRTAGVPKPFGVSDEEGNFEVSTFGTRDGAPPGEYMITFEYKELRLVGEEEVRDGKNLLPARYSDPRQTVLRFEVAEGNNEIPPLQLEADKPESAGESLE